MSAPDIGERERELVLEVLKGPTLSGGPLTERFEASVAALTGRRHAIAVSSGTAGLHLAVCALGLRGPARVLTTSFSFVASVNCLLYEGVEPVFADIDPVTYELDPESAEERVRGGPDVAAILPVHVFGQPCDMTSFLALATRLGCPVIEDACEALGAEHRGRPAGSFGDVAVFAFYPNKQMTTAEGGMIVTDSGPVAALCRSLRNQGRGQDQDWLSHVRLGYNYRLDELSAALGVAQLERLDQLIANRADVAARYDRALAAIDGVTRYSIAPSTTRMSWFVYVVALDRVVDRGRVAVSLEADGVPTRPYFRPIHQQPYFVERFGDRTGTLPITEDVGLRTLALPFHGRLGDESIGFVADALRRAVARS